MASSDIVVKIKADTREFDRALTRVRRQLWWMQYGERVIFAVLGLVMAGLVIVGVLLGMQVA